MAIVQVKFELNMAAYRGHVSNNVVEAPSKINFLTENRSPSFPNSGMVTADKIKRSAVVRRFWVLDISKI